MRLTAPPGPDLNGNLHAFGSDEGSGDVYIRAEPEGRTFRLHCYHLVKVSPVFADMFSLPQTDVRENIEGSSERNPIILQMRADAFAALLYFYDTPYEWHPEPVQSATELWQHILHMAGMFDMEDVKQTAIYAQPRRRRLPQHTQGIAMRQVRASEDVGAPSLPGTMRAPGLAHGGRD
ncbi:hypothetical protein GGG16DRAFT_110345 [Schizophyllum commune]